jgi:hypothetical protein
VILSFSTKELRDTCQQLERADATYGAKQAQALFSVLAEVDAAETAEDLQALHADNIVVAEDSLSIAFAPQCRAHFKAVPQAASDTIVSWSIVRRLKLVQVEVGANA